MIESQRRASNRASVLARLEQGPATNADLNQICYRYGARILELRGQGYEIETHQESRGKFSYVLVDNSKTRVQPPPTVFERILYAAA